MTISEMHVWFRQYAQQMGMQNVRAILPEQIDLLINTSITDVLNELIRENIGATNDRIITDNSKLGQINAFRTLYKVALIDLVPPAPGTVETRAFVFSEEYRNIGKMTTDFPKVSDTNLIPDYLYIVDFSINYKQTVNNQGYNVSELAGKELYYISNLDIYNTVSPNIENAKITGLRPDKLFSFKVFYNGKYHTYNFQIGGGTDGNGRPLAECDELPGNYLCISEVYDEYNNFSLEYILHDNPSNISLGDQYANPLDMYYGEDVDLTYLQPIINKKDIETNFFPVRLIEDSYLADTLNDFVLRNRLRSPIIVTYNNGVFDLYIDKFHKHVVDNIDYYTLDNGLIPYKLRMSYIAKPAVVKYATDIGGTDVDCDLPESMHVDILKHAVDLYNTSIQGNLYANQQQQQAQGRELARNQVRPQNDGYQN